MTDARTTRAQVESLVQADFPDARSTRVVVEALGTIAASARTTRVMVEALVKPIAVGRFLDFDVDLLHTILPGGRFLYLDVDVLHTEELPFVEPGALLESWGIIPMGEFIAGPDTSTYTDTYEDEY